MIKPILFNGEMVRAILDGRKSVTRRIIKKVPPGTHRIEEIMQPFEGEKKVFEFHWGRYQTDRETFCDGLCMLIPPYQPGDILYVRETWGFLKCNDCMQKDECFPKVGLDGCYIYRTDYGNTEDDSFPPSMFKWHPSIHMPKSAARIWLKVTDVRVERLQDITIQGMIKEGVRAFGELSEKVEELFAELWDSTVKKSDINRFGWEPNPWVWVIEFERCEKPEERGA